MPSPKSSSSPFDVDTKTHNDVHGIICNGCYTSISKGKKFRVVTHREHFITVVFCIDCAPTDRAAKGLSGRVGYLMPSNSTRNNGSTCIRCGNNIDTSLLSSGPFEYSRKVISKVCSNCQNGLTYDPDFDDTRDYNCESCGTITSLPGKCSSCE